MVSTSISADRTMILLVDDDPDISEALSDLLEHEGYHVHLAVDGGKALEKAKQHHYSAVILDLGLPDMDGLEVLRSMLEIDAKLPIIVLTAYTTADKTIGALSQGAFAFLTKPYNRDQLKATLSRAVGVKALATRAETIESALTASEDRFQSVVQSASDGIIIADGRGLIISWNKAAKQLFGYTDQEIAGTPLTVIMPERYRDVHQRGVDRFRATGQSRAIGQTLQVDGLRKDGTEFPIELSLAAWSRGSEIYYCGIVRDMTERKRTQAALRSSEDRFRSLVSNIPGAVYRCACDRDWTMEFLSDAIEDLCGYPASDFIANRVRSYVSIIHPDDRAVVEHIVFGAVGAKRPYAMEYRIVHADGGIRWVYEKGQAVFTYGGSVQWLDGVIFDVTDRKRAEEALQESEERLRLALTAGKLGTWDWNLVTGAVIWSDNVDTFFGLRRGSFGGTYEAFLNHVHPQDRPTVEEAIRRAVERGEDYNIEHRIVRSDGTLRWVGCQGQVLRDDSGHALRMIGTIQCITDRKRDEEALGEQLRLATFSTELGIVLSRSKTLRDMLNLCTETIVHHLDAAFARIWLLNSERTVLELQASSGLYTHVNGTHSRVPVGSLKIGRIAKTGRPHVTNDVLNDPQISDREWARQEGMVAFAGYPLIVEDRLIGVVALFARQTLTDYTMKALAAAANAMAGGIERKQAEETLERLSRQHALILHSAGEGIYGVDLQGHTTFVNHAAARMLGWEADDLIGRPMHSLLHHTRPDGSPFPPELCPIYAAFKDGKVHSVYNDIFWRKNGTSFPVDYVSTPIYESGNLAGAVVVFQDTTERKVTEDALRESEELLRQVMENIGEVFWISDVEKTRIFYISPAYEEIWGRPCDSLRASPRAWLDAIHPDDRERVLTAALTKQAGGRYSEEYRIVRPDGSIRWIRDRAFPVRDASGAVYRIAGVAEDITKNKQDR